MAEETVVSEATFEPPSLELAQHAMRKVRFDERLVAHRMSAAAGTLRVDLYSFADMGRYLAGTRWRSLEAPDARTDINWVDPKTLTDWVENVVGDKALADAMRESIAEEGLSFRDQALRMAPLIAERYAQYEACMAPESEDPAESDETSNEE